jgi:capsular exopolysaccharide synthesis family protein
VNGRGPSAGVGKTIGEGATLNLQDFARLLRSRWVTMCVTIVVAVLGAVAYNLLTTPLYQASTRLFVSTWLAGTSVAQVAEGNQFSQERVKSYTEILTSRALAQRTIDKLGLDMSAETLQKNVSASAEPESVLINIEVLDESPDQARDIANTLSAEFISMARGLETPPNGDRPEARVVIQENASAPDHPVIPKTARNLALGLALGVALGLGFAVVRDLLDNSVKDRRTVEEITGVRLVGSIPFDKELQNEQAISFDGDSSVSAELFRKLRMTVEFLTVDHPSRVIVVAGSTPNEGASSTAINIALALAEAEHNVVVVDCDLRRPSLDRYLGGIAQVGFSTVLSGAASLSEALQKTRFPRLTLLAAGTAPPNPSELIGSQATQKMLSELRARFDYVIVDSSPLLAATDAAVLAADGDGVLIVARFGKTKRKQLADAVANLNDVGAPLLGALLTMTPTRGSHIYNYGYGYGERKLRRASGRSSSPSTETTRSPEVRRVKAHRRS